MEMFEGSGSNTLMAPAAFRARFDGLNASPTLLLPHARLIAVFNIFISPDSTEADWEWLDAKLRACKEAKLAGDVDFAELPGSPPLLQHLLALTKAKLGSYEDAARGMSIAIATAYKRLTRRDLYPDSPSLVVEEYVKTVLAAGRAQDAATVAIRSGSRLQKLLATVEGSMDPGQSHTRLRRAFHSAFQQLEDPWQWLNAQPASQGEADKIQSDALAATRMGFLAALVSDTLYPVKAFSFWRKLSASDDTSFVPYSVASRLASSLANQQFYTAAHHVIAVLREKGGVLPHSTLSRELWIYANEGRPTESLKLWDEINSRHRPTPDDRLAVATAFAVNGQVDAAKQALEQLGTPEDDIKALHLLQRAALLAEDDQLALEYLNKIAKVEPSLKSFESQLRLYAQQGKPEPAISVFGRIIEVGLAPTLETYTSLISVFANSADHVNAQNVFNSMRASNIEPDAIAWSALLNAYIEAGAWQDAARIVEDIAPDVADDPNLRTIMLKAYVVAAAPLEPVLRLFRTIMLPPAQAWALVIQSAADNNNMVLARALFVEMDEATKLDSLAPQPNVYIMSILLAAYLRTGDRESARAVYDTMVSRDIVPTSITYGVITNSFAQAPGESSFKQAHNFAMSVYGQIKPGERTRARGKAMESVFTPLLVASVRTGDLGQAKQYYDLITETGGNSRSLAAKLMEAYRSAGQLRPLYRMWLKLFGQACKVIPPHPGIPMEPDGHSTRARNNVLAIPFSIVIRAFGDAGLHGRLTKLWSDMRRAGFGRDSQNYNHFATALAKTGDIEGAFHIVDRVLMSRHEEVKERYYEAMRAGDGQLLAVEADTTPNDVDFDAPDGDVVHDDNVNPYARDSVDDEYAFDEEDATEDREAERTTSDVAEPAHRPPNRRHQYHPDVPPQLLEGEQTVDLSILRQWRPSDVLWRPSVATLAVLDHAYRQLEDQKAYRAWVGLGTDGTDGDEEAPEVRLPEFGKTVIVREPDGSPKRMSPSVMLARLNKRYGRAVALVMFHRRKRKDLAAEFNRTRG
jgi:pentatricopeptide repeat protein